MSERTAFDKGRTHGCIARARANMRSVIDGIENQDLKERAMVIASDIDALDNDLREHRGMKPRAEV